MITMTDNISWLLLKFLKVCVASVVPAHCKSTKQDRQWEWNHNGFNFFRKFVKTVIHTKTIRQFFNNKKTKKTQGKQFATVQNFVPKI